MRERYKERKTNVPDWMNQQCLAFSWSAVVSVASEKGMEQWSLEAKDSSFHSRNHPEMIDNRRHDR